MTDTNRISVIESLLETVEDGKVGFEEAADKLDGDGNPALAAEMRELSQERLRMANELRALATSEGVTLGNGDGTVAGALHRGWMSVRDAVTGDDPHAVLAAAEQGEDHAVAEYERALKSDVPTVIRAVIERQYAEVRAAHDRVRDLRDSHN